MAALEIPVAQRARDLVLLQWWCRLQLRLGFNAWPGNFHMPWTWTKKNSQGGSPVCWWYPCWGTWISCHPPTSASFLVEGCCWGNSLPRTCVLMHSKAKESCPAERGKGWPLEVGLETLQESRPRGWGTSSCLLQPALASGNLNLLKSWY